MKTIDFHAHILPAADHGCADVRTSIQQLTLAKQARIDTVIATPHFYPQYESIEEFLTRRKQCSQKLAEAIFNKALPDVLIGAEVQLCPGMDRIEGLHRLCVQGTNILLLELPPHYSLRTFDNVIDNLIYSHKLKVVLAHIDRYPSSHVNFLLDSGCLAQINAESLCHFRSSRHCKQWLQTDSVVALGSDIHGIEHGYQDFLKAKARLGETFGQIMSRTEDLFR